MIKNADSHIFVVVDGVEKADFDLRRVNLTRFNLSSDAKELELYRGGAEGKEFIEFFPLDFDVVENQSFKQNFKLEGGERVTFQFIPIKEDGKISKINCGLTFTDKEISAEKTASAAPVVTSALAAAAASDTGVSKAGTPSRTVAASTSTFEASPINKARNRAILIPAVVLLILLLTIGIGWFSFREIENNQLAEENNPDKRGKEITNPVNKAKKEDITKDQAVLPDDISGGGDGDEEEEEEEKSSEDNKETASGDTKSPVNSDDKTATSKPTSSKKPLISSTSPVRNNGAAGGTGNDIKTTEKLSTKRIRQTLSAKSDRSNAEKSDIIKLVSSVEARRTPIKQRVPGKTVTLSSLNKVNNAVADKQIFDAKQSEQNDQVGQRITEDRNLSNTEKISLNQGLSDKSLLEIKKVYLKWDGDIDTGILINQKVVEEIRDADLFALMQNKKDADAELQINIKYEKSGDSPKNPLVTADMKLINAFGTVLTPTAENGKTLWKYDGKLEKMPKKIVSDVNGLVAEASRKKAQTNQNTANVKEVKIPKPQIKPITDETAVLNENIETVKKVNVEGSQVGKNQVDKNPEGKSLTDIKKVYLEWQGDIDTGVKVNQDLIETIQHSGIMNVMREKKDADGTLQINIKNESGKIKAKNPKVSADMRLINSKGETLTPTENGKTAWKYIGELKKMPNKVVKDVKGLVEKEKKEKKENQEKIQEPQQQQNDK